MPQVSNIVIVTLPEFLRSTNMESYHKHFVSNGFDDLRIATAMNADDLEEIGVPPPLRCNIDVLTAI